MSDPFWKKSWPERFPVAQFPNVPLAVAIAGAIATRLVEGRARDYAQAIFFVGLGIWAYLELAEGVNWFRRLVGAAGLAYTIARVASALDN